ncbi:MAG: PQQ-dependent sugar dehydrogenase [Bryobacterales bacterium]|nr:PQQ-dependent sugar dehydrogenase [Bryobacterales bacterium]MBV9398030.1 PQQ-dependent sugar dehydrogenase [Bryobacterales bacterium]
MELDPQFVPRPEGFLPTVPAGFSVSIFAAAPELGRARWMAVAPNGDIFLTEIGSDRIAVLRDLDGDGKADMATTFVKGFLQPHGMAFHNGFLYVADLRAIWRLPYRDGDTAAAGKPERVTTAPDLRPIGWHYTREIAFDSKGALYLTIGARKDLEDDDPPPDATVQLVAGDGSMSTFASGLRNVVGLAVQPRAGGLWGTVNERDMLGARLPPDFLAHIGQGDFFGWPYAYAGRHPDPTFGPKRPDLVAKSKTPEVLFEAHSAPLGVVFYDKEQFPAEYRGDALVTLHGSGPYDKPDGYKVVRVRFNKGKPTGGYEDFMTGFFARGNPVPKVWGTPAGIAVAKDGSLLVSDDKARVIWRVRYKKK